MKRASFLFAGGACACMFLALNTNGAPQPQPPAHALVAGETRSARGGGNDDCTTPQMIGDGPTEYSTIGNTTDGLPHQACLYYAQTYHDDWFTYIATCDGLLTVSTCDNADYNTDLVIYAGYHPGDWTCPPGDGPMRACNDDTPGCAGFTSEIVLPVTTGNSYTIRVGGWRPGHEGTGTLTITCVVPSVCGDDICEDAEDCCTCDLDCGPCVCGDGSCQPCENCDECLDDCGECPGSCAPADLTYDDGDSDGISGGTHPPAGWTTAGMVNDFILPDPDGGGTGNIFTCAQVTFAVDPNQDPTVWELRVYDLNNVDGAGGGDGTIVGMGSYAAAVPVCMRTYTTADGTLVITDTGDVSYGRPVKTFDGVGTPCYLGEGHFGFHIMFPGIDSFNYWKTAPQDGNPNCLADWGPAIDIPDDLCASHRLKYQATDFKIWGSDLDCPSGVCDDIENTCNCSEDCGSETCGNDICCVSEDEDCESCPEDCGDCPTCGDGKIEPSEDCDPPGALCVNGELCLDDCTCPGPPNDHCVDHMPIFDGDTDYVTIGASTDGLQHVNICAYDGQTYHDIWYNYTAWCTGELTVTTCDQADYDTDLVIYDGCYDDIPCPPTDAHLLGCNDDNYDCTGYYSSKVRVPVLSGNCYTIRVGGWYEGSMGTGTVTVTCDGGCGDGVCLPGEDCCSCPADCCVCGDGTCDPCEDCYECPEECEDCVCPAPRVYDNGHWTGINAGRPTAGWSLAGCIDDFVVPDPDFGGTSFSCAQVGFFNYGNDILPTAWDLRIYDLNDVDGQGGGDGTIAGLGDFNLAVPKCFLAYSVDDGSMIVTNTDDCGFSGCIFVFDGVGEVCDLAPGSYGFHVMFPGTGAENFWLTAPQDDSECLAVWGPAEPFPFDFCGPASPEFHNVHFNMRGFQPCEECPFDSDDDGQVGAFDLAILLGAWGACDGEECLCVDANADGQVDAFDLANLLGAWGPCG